ncbi:MAG TPA: hypothetical protein VGP97_21155 [Burkholderiales bacterium]|jgi:hypothetical protein|nr:hypothetical protein [Burkholderiales bacterium]
MNRDRLEGVWRHLKGVAGPQWGRLTAHCAKAITRRADEKRLAEWLARQHKIDAIHK